MNKAKKISAILLIGATLGVIGCEKAPDPAALAIFTAEQEVRCEAIKRIVFYMWEAVEDMEDMEKTANVKNDDAFDPRNFWTDIANGKDVAGYETPKFAKLMTELFPRRDLWESVPVDSSDKIHGRDERNKVLWKIAKPICMTIPGIESAFERDSRKTKSQPQ